MIEPNGDLVYHLDFNSKWSDLTKILVIPNYFKICKLLNEKVVNDDHQI